MIVISYLWGVYMKKGSYSLVYPSALKYLSSANKFVLAILIMNWLIEELYKELEEELEGVEVEVVGVENHTGGPYPNLGLNYEGEVSNDMKLEKLVEETCDRLLKEKPIKDLINFIGDMNWETFTKTFLREDEKEHRKGASK
jgi:hypothetical protein